MVIFQVYPTLRDRGGAEKMLLAIAGSLARNHQVFILSEDHEPEMPPGVKHIPLRLKHPLLRLFTLSNILLAIRKHRPDVVHSHHRMPTMLFSILKRTHPFKLIHTAHVTFNDKKIFRFSRADLYIAVGRQVADNLHQTFSIPLNKIRTIINGVPTPASTPASSVCTENGMKNTAIAVGRLSKQKGHFYLIEAWKTVVDALGEAHLVVLGDGDLKDILHRQVKNARLENYIHFKGHQPNATEWMSRSCFVILSSLWEGLPLTVLEAFSVKRTVVATTIQGTTEVVEDGRTGLLVPPRNISMLAQAITGLFRNPEKRKTLEDNAYKEFLAKYSHDRMLKEYQMVIEGMDGKGAPKEKAFHPQAGTPA